MHRNGKTSHHPVEPLRAPAALPQVLVVSSQEPAASSQTPEASQQEPAASSQTPAASPQTPAASPQAPAASPQTPAASPRASTVSRRAGRASYQAETSMARRLLAAQAAINAALGDPALLETLTARGYGEAALKEGQDLVARARELYAARHDLVGDRVAATRASEAALADASATYMAHVATARVALRGDDAAAAKLDIGSRERRRAGWLLQAQRFYLNALRNASIVEALGRYGVTQQQLEEGQRLVEAVLTCHNTRQKHGAAAREAVVARDLAFQSLDRWMRDFLAIARIALASQPGALERLGIVSS